MGTWEGGCLEEEKQVMKAFMPKQVDGQIFNLIQFNPY